MRSAPRHHASYVAFVGHRLSGLALAIFLPLHFLALGLALEGRETFDGFLAYADMPFVKAAEWGLVVLLSVHLFFGVRLLALELLPWRRDDDLRTDWIGWGAGGAVVAGLIFLMGAFGFDAG